MPQSLNHFLLRPNVLDDQVWASTEHLYLYTRDTREVSKINYGSESGSSLLHVWSMGAVRI